MGNCLHRADLQEFWLVGLRGLEPRTSSLSGKRSNRLSYRPFSNPLTGTSSSAAAVTDSRARPGSRPRDVRPAVWACRDRLPHRGALREAGCLVSRLPAA